MNLLQKARQARIRMAKNASGAAFLNSKKRAEEMALAQDTGMDVGDHFKEQDKFNMQHHHLLNCLENTTVSKKVAKYIAAFPLSSRYIVYRFHSIWKHKGALSC